MKFFSLIKRMSNNLPLNNRSCMWKWWDYLPKYLSFGNWKMQGKTWSDSCLCRRMYRTRLVYTFIRIGQKKVVYLSFFQVLHNIFVKPKYFMQWIIFSPIIMTIGVHTGYLTLNWTLWIGSDRQKYASKILFESSFKILRL